MMARLLMAIENRIYYILILGLLIGTTGSTSFVATNNTASYVAFLLLILLFLVRLLKENPVKTISNFKFQIHDAIPLCLLLIWFYGFMQGQYLHNENTTRNFAGMGIYLIYYVLLIGKVNKFLLLRYVLIAAAVNAIYMYGSFIWDKFFSQSAYGHMGFTYFDVRSYYAETLILLAVPIVLGLYGLFSLRYQSTSNYRGKYILGLIFLLGIYVFAFLQISLSKASELCYVIYFLGFLGYYWKNILNLFLKRKIQYLMVIGVVVAINIFPATVLLRAYLPKDMPVKPVEVAPSDHVTPPMKIFTVYLEPNMLDGRIEAQVIEQAQARSIRQLQTTEIMNDLTFLGKGLGARLESGYLRDAGGYGFEANYLNLAHKFGVLSVLIFATYLYVFYKIWYGLNQYKTRYLALGSLSILVGLLMAIGNPILMSPVMVAMHAIVLYWLRNDSNKAKAV